MQFVFWNQIFFVDMWNKIAQTDDPLILAKIIKRNKDTWLLARSKMSFLTFDFRDTILNSNSVN